MTPQDISKKDETTKRPINPLVSTQCETPPSLTVDVDYYQGIIDDPKISTEFKRELIEIIGAIVMHFIDLGFGVHTIQLAQDTQPITTKEKLLERSHS